MNDKSLSSASDSSVVQSPLTMSKRGAAVKERIQQFYSQLTDGCGRKNCTNADCASNPSFEHLSYNDAAARAITLFKNKVSLCEKPPSKIPRKDTQEENTRCASSSQGQNDVGSSGEPSNGVVTTSSSPTSSESSMIVHDPEKDKGVGTNTVENSEVLEKEQSPVSSPMCSNLDTTYDASIINKKLQNISVNESSDSSRAQHSMHSSQKFVPSDAQQLALDLLSKVELQIDDTSHSTLKENIWTVFSDLNCLNLFCLKVKEDLHSERICDEDKDIDESDKKLHEKKTEKLTMDDLDTDAEIQAETSKAGTSNTDRIVFDKYLAFRPTVNINHVRTLYKLWSSYPDLERVMLNAIAYQINNIEQGLTKNIQAYKQNPNYLNMFVLLIENPSLHSPEALEKTFPYFCKMLSRLPIKAQAILARYWSGFDQQHLRNIIESLQQLITFKVVSEADFDDDSGQHWQVSEGIISASKCLNILFYASILGGNVDKEVDTGGAAKSGKLRSTSKIGLSSPLELLSDSEDDQFFTWVDDLGKELSLDKMDSVSAVVTLTEFINEPLNDFIKIDKDYTNYRISQKGPTKFSFLHYPFLLSTVSKITHLFYDNRVTMYSERRRTLFSSIMHGSLVHPYLKIKVRRSNIIADTLVQLELATENAKDLKKQLYVEFDGEEGVDEGGVSKEFFQLVVDKIFNPENGMFVYNEESRSFWFNPHSFEALTQYKLIGIVLGLAIYNNCILDINFPSFIYKKLLGRKAKFHDMADLNPVLYRSLQELLTYEGNVEEDMMVTFRVEYQDVFGCVHYHDLKDDGENIPVTNENRQEYVKLYTDYLLNTSICEQFNAFLVGFDLVVSESPLKYLFYPEELELLIRGSENYDFFELERTTEYDGGFTKTSQTIVDFWAVAHQLSDNEKRSLLQFSTGSDRAPVGGLSRLKMIIARNGPDSNRLPTAHTCFNVILLPDYKNREKLKERLLKAIKYSKGFGML